MDTENKSLEVDVSIDKVKGELKVKDYEDYLARSKEAVGKVYVPETISNDEDNRKAKATRATLNAIARQISDKRISSIDDFTSDFQEKMKLLTSIFKDKADELKKPIDDYANRLAKPKVIVITCKTYDRKVADKLFAYCEKNAIKAEEKK